MQEVILKQEEIENIIIDDEKKDEKKTLTKLVSDLANVLDMTKSAVSHQLKALRLSKLIKSRKQRNRIHPDW